MGPVQRNEQVSVIDVHINDHTNGVHPLKGKNGANKTQNGYSAIQSVQSPRILPNILHQIGHTPMVKLNRIPRQEGIECDIFAKCELYGPGGSHKDRIALRMIEEAEADGRLKPGYTIIEPTSGNTGIAVAMVCAVKGYKCILVMPEKMSAEKHETMAGLGAKVVRTPKNVLHTAVAAQIHKETPNSIILDQYGNQDNPRIHYETTAQEIIDQCEGRLDMIVMGVGTGGIISGIGKKIKEALPSCQVIGVDPEGSIMALPDSINQTSTNFWEVEGIGHDWLPDVLDRSVVDSWVKCNDKETFNMARRLIKEEGLLVGGSCGSALVGAIKAIKAAGLGRGDRVVIVLPDSVRNYMSKFLSDQWMHERDFLPDVTEVTEKYDWWTRSVSSLLSSGSRIQTPTLTLDSTVGQAIYAMRQQRLDQLPVVDEQGHMLGMATLNHLLKSVPSTEITSSTPLGRFLFSQYKRVLESDSLGKLSYVLQGAPFAVVVQPVPTVNAGGKTIMSERLVGVLTAMDLAEATLL